MKTILAGILLMVASTFADVCKPPQQISGNYNVFAHNIDKNQDHAFAGKMYYDGINKRIRVEGHSEEGKAYIAYQYYEEGKQYVVTGGECISMPLKGDFKPMELPKGSQLVNGGRIGTGGNSLDVNRYAGVEQGAKFIATVTQADCVFTSGVVLAKTGDVNVIGYISMTDVTVGIDEEMFKKPTDCKETGSVRGRHRRSAGGIFENLVMGF